MHIKHLQIVYIILVKLEIWKFIDNVMPSTFLDYVSYFNKISISHMVYLEKHRPV